MKKSILALVFCLICSTCFAAGRTVIVDGNGDELFQSNGKVITADTLVKTGQGTLQSVFITADANAAGDLLRFYDNITYSGTIVCSAILGAADAIVPMSFPTGIKFTTGLYADWTGSGQLVTTVVYE